MSISKTTQFLSCVGVSIALGIGLFGLVGTTIEASADEGEETIWVTSDTQVINHLQTYRRTYVCPESHPYAVVRHNVFDPTFYQVFWNDKSSEHVSSLFNGHNKNSIAILYTNWATKGDQITQAEYKCSTVRVY